MKMNMDFTKLFLAVMVTLVNVMVVGSFNMLMVNVVSDHPHPVKVEPTTTTTTTQQTTTIMIEKEFFRAVVPKDGIILNMPDICEKQGGIVALPDNMEDLLNMTAVSHSEDGKVYYVYTGLKWDDSGNIVHPDGTNSTFLTASHFPKTEKDPSHAILILYDSEREKILGYDYNKKLSINDHIFNLICEKGYRRS